MSRTTDAIRTATADDVTLDPAWMVEYVWAEDHASYLEGAHDDTYMPDVVTFDYWPSNGPE